MFRIKVKNRAYATKITDVVETYTRERRDVIREGKMRIKDETEVTRKSNHSGFLTPTVRGLSAIAELHVQFDTSCY